MIDMVVDQRLLGFPNGLFHGVKLLSNIEARPALPDHRNDPTEMSLGPFQPLHDVRVGLMNVPVLHALSYPPP
jgi:hypothetical protein